MLTQKFEEIKSYLSEKGGILDLDEIMEVKEYEPVLELFSTLSNAFDIDVNSKSELKESLEDIVENADEETLKKIVAEYKEISGREEVTDEEIEALFANLVALKNTLEKVDDEKFEKFSDELFDYYVKTLEEEAEKVEEEEKVVEDEEGNLVKEITKTFYFENGESTSVTIIEDIEDETEMEKKDESTEILEDVFNKIENKEETEAKRKCKKKKKKVKKATGEILEESIEECDCPEGVEEGEIIEEIEYIEDEVNEGEETKDESLEAKDEAATKEKIKIVSPKDKVSTKPWGQIDKTKLKHDVKNLLDNNVPGAKEALYEIFGLVRCEDKLGCWKYPHHELDGNDVVLNTNGLRAAVVYLVRKRSLKALTPEERVELAKHLIRHYKELEREVPPSLQKIVENKESLVYIKVSDEELNEIKESFKINDEDILTVLAIIEDLVSDMVDAGIIEIEGVENAEGEIEIIKTIGKEHLENLLKIFDQFTTKVANLLNGNADISDIKDESILEEMSRLKDEIKGYISIIEKLKGEVEDKNLELERTKEELKSAKESLKDFELLKAKYEEIVKHIKENGDEGLKNYVEAINDVTDELEFKALKKLKESILNPSFKKKQLIKNEDTERIIEILGQDGLEEKQESVKVEKEVRNILDLL